MDIYSFETKVRVFRSDEVQREGLTENGSSGPTFWGWIPGFALPKVEEGKKIVLLYPCNCGCWKDELTKRSIELINRDPNPERFVLVQVDPRYIVHKDENLWHISDRPPRYTGAG